MAGYQSKYKNYDGGKYGQQSLQEMVDVHFQQLATKIKLQGLTPELKKEQAFLEEIYEPFMKGE
tara:strand:- start:1754 stop:1945 length:192 start_codon:yes stop_codon:yes gene_type:complete